MVRKVLKFLYKETRNLHEAAYLLGLFAVLSQVLAFLRDRLLAHLFGAGTELDVYYAAFRIPDFLFVTVASVVSISVLVPFIVENEKRSKEAVREFIDSMFTFFSLLILAFCTLAYFLIPSVSEVLFKGFSADELEQAILLSRILLISPIALGVSNLLGSLTQAYNRFTIYALAPLLYNVGIISGIVFLAPEMGVMGVAIGVSFGAILHALVQVPFSIKIGLIPRWRTRLDLSTIKRVSSLSLPRTLTLSTSHIATLFLVSAASLMVAGSISVLSFALNLQSVPLSIIGVSYSLAAFPTLTRHFANKNIDAFITQMTTTARHIIFWALPVTSLFIVLRAQIVRVLLGTGEFDWSDTRLTAAALAIFAVSSVFQCLLLLFIRGFYSAGYTKKPFVYNLFSTFILILCVYLLIKSFYAFDLFRSFISSLMKVEDVTGTVVLMLPLGFTLGTIINGLVHWVGFERQFRGFSRGVTRTLFESFSASVIMGFFTYTGLNIFAEVINTSSLFGIFLQGFLSAIVGILSLITALYILDSKELHEGWKAFHTKFWKAKVIASDPEIV